MVIFFMGCKSYGRIFFLSELFWVGNSGCKFFRLGVFRVGVFRVGIVRVREKQHIILFNKNIGKYQQNIFK